MTDRDVEKNLSINESEAEASLTTIPAQRSGWGGFVDSFKAPVDPGFDRTGLTDQQVAMAMIERSKPKLTKRHLRMITAAGGVGTGLFIGTGNSLKTGGPAALLIGFGIIGFAVFCTMCALGELGVRYPIPSSFTTYADRFIDPSWGFTLSWMYGFCWMVVVPLELIAAAMTIEYWKNDDNAAARVNPVAWISLFYVAVCALNIIGTRGYGEAEFVIGAIKVSTVVGFIIFGIVVTAGGGPHHEYVGAHYWHEPGAFANGFKGVVTVLVSSAFAYGGTEIAGVAAASTKNPQQALPSAIKQVVWRVLILFIVGTLMIGLLVPYNRPELGTASKNPTSPFVLAVNMAGVTGLPSVINTVIMMSVFSVANAAVFASSRTYVALALEGQAPAWLAYIDRNGRPMGALIVVMIFSLLCFVAASDKYQQVFDWLYAFTALSFLYAWGSVCFCHIRHRQAMKKNGISTSELLYRSPTGVIGSYIGLIVCVGTLGIQFWTSIWPVGSPANAEYFFKQDLSIPVALLCFIGHKIWSRSKFVTLDRMDITDNVRQYDVDEILAQQEEERMHKKKSVMYRVGKFLC